MTLTKQEADMEYSTTQRQRQRRSLRSVPPTYAPSLVFSHGKKFSHQTFCTLADGLYHLRRIPEMYSTKCIATCYGWLILNKYFSTHCYLFNPVTLAKIDLPPLIHYTFNIGVLTSPPGDPNCVIIFFSNKKKSCIFCRIGDNNWIEQVFGYKMENPDDYVSAVSCNGKIYLLSTQGVVVINVHDTFASIEPHETKSRKFSIPESCCYDSFLVESCGEIFQVCKIYLGLSDKTIQNLNVFKLDSSAMAWVKVESLGDRIFLLGTSSTSLSSTELGVKGNCIYFSCPGYTSLYRFDMDDKTITSSLPCPKGFPHWRGPFWVVPNCKLQVKKEVAMVVEEARDKRKEKDLPLELLELILSGLFLGDCIRFRLVCKDWLSITPPIRSYNLAQSKSGSQQLPWLLSFLENKGQCNFYHPIYSDVYTMNHPELAGAIIRHAKYGWLLMSQGSHTVFFFNPCTMETIKLPDLGSYLFVNITFSAPPTSSDFVVFGHEESYNMLVDLLVYLEGHDTWYRIRREIPYSFLPSDCSPVFCDGVFYSLGTDGKLGVFNPNEDDEEKAWSVLPNISIPQFSSLSFLSLFLTPIRSFIMEYDGEILSVFVGVMGKQIWVFKLDRSKMKWVRLESLGDKVMFLSNATSVLVPAGLKGIENRIYFPRFQGKDSLFYSLSTGNYHSFGSKDSRADWENTCEHLSCTWI